jgi:O-antigen ligase
VWLFRKLGRGESWEFIIGSPWIFSVALFIIWVAVSAGWAVNPLAPARGAIQLCLLCGLGLVVADLVRSWERAEWLTRAAVLGGSFAAYLTLQQAFDPVRRLAAGDTVRAGDDIAGGVNATAAMLLALLPFAFYLFRTSRSNLWRFVGLAYLPLSVMAIGLTYSRMVLLLLPLVLAVLAWQTIRGKRGRALLFGSALIGLITLTPFVPTGEIVGRVSTIPLYIASALQPEQESLSVYSGRGYHMQIALAIARDHPIIGAGYDSYGSLFLHEYQFEVLGAPTLIFTKRSPHSSWLGILADLGAVGVLLWSAVLGAAIFLVLKSWRRTRLHPMSAGYALSQTSLVCLLLYALPYGFYFQTQREKFLWVLMGFALALYRLSEPGNAASRDAIPGPE